MAISPRDKRAGAGRKRGAAGGAWGKFAVLELLREVEVPDAITKRESDAREVRVLFERLRDALPVVLLRQRRH